MKVNFDELHPIERPVILVASDNKYEALKEEIPWGRIIKLIPLFLLPYSFLLPLLSMGQDKLKELLKRGEIPLPHISPKEAVDRFNFDHGHPVDGGAYLSHPVLDDHYLVPSVANERLAQEKVAAFTDLTAALGAKTVKLITAEFLDKKNSAKMDISADAARFGIHISNENGVDKITNVFREYDQPGQKPYVPDHVYKWLDEDPLFRSIANGRTQAKVRTDKAHLHIKNHYRIDSNITLGLEGKGIHAGTELRDVFSSVYSFKIEYWPLTDTK